LLRPHQRLPRLRVQHAFVVGQGGRVHRLAERRQQRPVGRREPPRPLVVIEGLAGGEQVDVIEQGAKLALHHGPVGSHPRCLGLDRLPPERQRALALQHAPLLGVDRLGVALRRRRGILACTPDLADRHHAGGHHEHVAAWVRRPDLQPLAVLVRGDGPSRQFLERALSQSSLVLLQHRDPVGDPPDPRAPLVKPEVFGQLFHHRGVNQRGLGQELALIPVPALLLHVRQRGVLKPPHDHRVDLEPGEDLLAAPLRDLEHPGDPWRHSERLPLHALRHDDDSVCVVDALRLVLVLPPELAQLLVVDVVILRREDALGHR